MQIKSNWIFRLQHIIRLPQAFHCSQKPNLSIKANLSIKTTISMYCHVLIYYAIYFSLAKSQHYSDVLIEIFTQYGDHLYRYEMLSLIFRSDRGHIDEMLFGQM